MIDLRYHIVSIIAVFLALGLGVLIGSTIVSDDVMVVQQQKLIDGLEEKFEALRVQETNLQTDNSKKEQMISNYENFSQAVLGPLVKDRLKGTQVAIIVTGGQDIPAGLLNTLSTAGATVSSQTVVLNNINLKDPQLRQKVIQFYGLEPNSSAAIVQQKVAQGIALLVSDQADENQLQFLQQSNLLKMSGINSEEVNNVILVGGSDKKEASFEETLDGNIISSLIKDGKNVIGVEGSKVKISYMKSYQKYNITTIDDIDLSPGQISLVLAIKGEPGDYGIKSTASKFMPALPVEYLSGGSK
jgi:hypothetical protein